MRLVEIIKNRYYRYLLLPQWFGINNPWSSSFQSFSGSVDKTRDLINTAMGVAALIAVIILIYGGYTFITAAGDPEKVDRGNKIITGAVVGLVIVFISRLIVTFLLTEIIF